MQSQELNIGLLSFFPIKKMNLVSMIKGNSLEIKKKKSNRSVIQFFKLG